MNVRLVRWIRVGGLLSVAACFSTAVRAATLVFDSVAALNAKLSEAKPGDSFVLKNGTYTLNSPLLVASVGSADQPITIAAETAGDVEFTGTNGLTVAEPAAHVIISGFKFAQAAGKNAIEEGTHHVRLTRSTFRCVGDGPDLAVSGDDVEIDHNDFGDKATPGSLIAISGSGSQVARRVWIHHNFFHDFGKPAGTGTEMIRFGLSTTGSSKGAGLVEHNLFARCLGQNDLISNRASGTTLRYNSFIESPNSTVTLRHGNESVIEGNVFRMTGGLRIYGDRHLVTGNYFDENYIGVNLGNGDAEAAGDASPSSHDRPDDCVIAFNTFVKNRTHYQMSRRTPGGLGATNITFANNLLQGAQVAVKIEGPYATPVWSGNLLWQNAATGDLPRGGFTSADPMLVAGPDGIQHLQRGSPAIGAATGKFAAIATDLAGQPRTDPKSIGAEELLSADSGNVVLTPDEVGPAAKERVVVPRVP